jgi:predicted nucleic acid-binding protein
VTYLDSSVALAFLFAETQQPPAELWEQELFSSRLLQYEVWNRIHARRAEAVVGQQASAIINQVLLLELSPSILARALAPFPLPLRTLDALHLATMVFVRNEGRAVDLASYDARLLAGASALGIEPWSL